MVGTRMSKNGVCIYIKQHFGVCINLHSNIHKPQHCTQTLEWSSPNSPVAYLQSPHSSHRDLSHQESGQWYNESFVWDLYKWFKRTLTSWVSLKSSLANESKASIDFSTKFPPMLQTKANTKVVQMKGWSLAGSIVKSTAGLSPTPHNKEESREQRVITRLISTYIQCINNMIFSWNS